MRITALVIFILCINLSSAIIGSSGLFLTQPTDATTTQLMETVNQSYLGSSVSSGNVATQFGDFVTGLYTFIKLFFTSLALPSLMLQNYGVPVNIANWISYPIYFIYLVALIQMISGRYVE